MFGETLQEIPQSGDAPTATVRTVPERRLYPVNDAAVLLGISPRKTWELIYAVPTRLETVELDGRRLVPAEVIDEFVGNLRQVAAAKRAEVAA